MWQQMYFNVVPDDRCGLEDLKLNSVFQATKFSLFMSLSSSTPALRLSQIMFQLHSKEFIINRKHFLQLPLIFFT